MASAATPIRYTPEQYLALERKAPYKIEYLDGFLIAMAGASRAHNLIVVNFRREVSEQLKDQPWEVYAGQMRVHVEGSRFFAYPDVVVVCGEPRFQDDVFDTLLNPVLIVEVQSPSTESYDRGRKFGEYRKFDSLQEYVLVSQERVWVEQYTRRGKEWVSTEYRDRGDVLRLSSVGCEIPLAEIYAKVSLPDEGKSLGPHPAGDQPGPNDLPSR